MLYSTVLSFSILSNDNRVDIVIGGLESGNTSTWPDVGKQVKRLSKG